jgi:uncharacterized protein (TIGR02217 family)
VRTEFALRKRYGDEDDAEARPISRPVLSSVLVSVDGLLTQSGWQLLDRGIISFAEPPAIGTRICAGFHFDVPVRFAEDQLEIDADLFAAGSAPRVPLIEIRE